MKAGTTRPGVAGPRKPTFLPVRLEMLALPAAIVAMMLLFAWAGDGYLSASNLANIANQATYLAIFASAQLLVLLVRGLDLSIGHAVSMVSVVSALVVTGAWGGMGEGPAGAMAGVAAGLGTALLVGAFNGIGVACLRVNPFVTTLASFNICFGLASMLSGGRPIAGVPAEFSRLFYGSTGLAGLSIPIVWTGLVLGVIQFVLTCTRLGRSWYLIGGNPRAAILAGIATRRSTVLAYLACSFVAGIGALMLTARTGSGEPNLGGDVMLQSIAAAAIGGVGMRGGHGNVAAALLGAIFITVLSNGMNLLQINGYLQQIALGLVIVAVVSLDRRR